jgi:hypothetical protein
VLLQVIQEKPSVELVAESINAIIDIYSEDDVHVNQFKQLKILSKLQEIFQPFSEQAANFCATSSDQGLKDRIEEVCMNAEAFIQYKLSLA